VRAKKNSKGIDFKHIIKGVGAGLSLLDRNLRIVWVNKIQSVWFGKAGDLRGKNCYRMFERRKHICRGCPTVKVFKDGQIHAARRIGFTADGSKRYYQLTVSPVKDSKNKVDFALELVQDVTAQVIRERISRKIIQKLKNMCRHLSQVNHQLSHNIKRLKSIAKRLYNLKSAEEEKYRQKSHLAAILKDELQDIFRVNQALTSSVDLKKISYLITRLSCQLAQADACTLRILAEDKNALLFESSFGLPQPLKAGLSAFAIKSGEGLTGRVIKSRRPQAVYNIKTDPRVSPKCKALLIEKRFKSMLSVPILFQKEALGVITVFSRKNKQLLREAIEVLEIFASQVAIALQETRHYEDIHKNYFDTVHALVLTEEARDPFTRGHTERVTKFAVAMAKRMRLLPSEIETIRYASEVHDIGKIGIPDFILGKPGRLTPAERAMIELHPVKGVEMLEPLEFLRPSLPAVRHHHERFDGTGYPDGLAREKIPLLARILACADSFDAMTSHRPYRSRKLSVEEAVSEIKNNSGSQFDPQIAQSFIQLIRSQK